MPEVFEQAQVVGKWVWLEFNVAPVKPIRDKLKQLGFHWNAGRKCWQHPCGVPAVRSGGDPRSYYQVTAAADMALNDAPAAPAAKEYKVIALRECPLPESLAFCDTPDRAAEYWRLHVRPTPISTRNGALTLPFWWTISPTQWHMFGARAGRTRRPSLPAGPAPSPALYEKKLTLVEAQYLVDRVAKQVRYALTSDLKEKLDRQDWDFATRLSAKDFEANRQHGEPAPAFYQEPDHAEYVWAADRVARFRQGD